MSLRAESPPPGPGRSARPPGSKGREQKLEARGRQDRGRPIRAVENRQGVVGLGDQGNRGDLLGAATVRWPACELWLRVRRRGVVRLDRAAVCWRALISHPRAQNGDWEFFPIAVCSLTLRVISRTSVKNPRRDANKAPIFASLRVTSRIGILDWRSIRQSQLRALRRYRRSAQSAC